jgi:hypothetical protein
MVKKSFIIILVLLLLVGSTIPVTANQPTQGKPMWETAMNTSLDWMREVTPDGPHVGGVVGDWAVRSMALAGRVDAADPWTAVWLNELKDPPPLALRRWTDYQRVTLVLDALGLDATDFHGKDFTEPYSRFLANQHRHAMNRTILADIYALIALETVGVQNRWFLGNLYNAQRPDGTWSLNPALPSSVFDIDITAMALQAIAPFYHRGEARAVRAVGLALGWLEAQTFRDAESTTQMIIALVALGEDYEKTAAQYVQTLLQWYNPAVGGFVRQSNRNTINAMATVQAAYALTVYYLR